MQPHTHYLALVLEAEARNAVYRDLFRGELDEAVISDLCIALQQGQALGSKRFKVEQSVASGVNRTHAWRGKSENRDAESASKEDQTDFGFQLTGETMRLEMKSMHPSGFCQTESI